MNAESVVARRDAVVVLGMHRSGTSALTRVLSLAGAELPSNVMAPNVGNEDGHWEPQEVAELNEQIFADLDSGWSDTLGPRDFRRRILELDKYLPNAREVIRRNYGDANMIVLKEPRISLFVDLWREALCREGFNPSFIISVRHPAEVSESLKYRDGFIKNKSLILWAVYMLSCEEKTRNSNRMFIKYEDLMTDPEVVLDRIETELGLRLPRRTWGSLVEIQEFLKIGLKHHSSQSLGNYLRDFGEIEKLYNYFDAASRGEFWNTDVTSEARDWIDRLESTVGPLLKQLERNADDARSAVEAERRSALAVQQRLEAELASVAEHAAGREIELTAELGSFQARLGERESEMELRLAETTAQTEAAAHRRTELEAEISRLRAELQEARSALEAESAAWGQERDQANQAAEALSAAAAARQAAADARVAELVDALDSSRTQLEAWAQRRAEVEAALAAARSEFDLKETSLRAQVQSALDATRTLQQRAAELEGALESNQAQFADREAQFVSREDELSKQLSDARLDIQGAKRTQAEFETALIAAEARLKAQEASARTEASELAARRDAELAARDATFGAELAGREADFNSRLATADTEFRNQLALAETRWNNRLAGAEAEIGQLQQRSSELAAALSDAVAGRIGDGTHQSVGQLVRDIWRRIVGG